MGCEDRSEEGAEEVVSWENLPPVNFEPGSVEELEWQTDRAASAVLGYN